MKIAIDIREAGGEKAGKGWYTFNIVQNLLRQDEKNEYILYARDGIPGFGNFKNARLRLFSGRGPLWHYQVARDVKKENVDIFFAPSSYIIPSILPANIKIVLTVHDLVAFLYPNTHNKKATIIEKVLLRHALRRAAHVCAVSENTRNDILQRFHYDPKKIDVISCAAGEEFQPIQPEKLKDFIMKTNLPENFFLAVGTLEPRKNYLNLIKAFKEISDRFPEYYLVIVGKNGWDYEEIHAAVKENYLNKKVHFLGYLSNKSLVNLYSLARALVFPSFYEGFGMPPLEAMQCGCPVIASHTSSLPEVAGDAALLVSPESHRQIAEAMLKIIKDPALAIHLHEKGLQQAKKFSWEKSAKKLLRIFQKKH
ncbi:glycosyltransferase family 4 protein [Candidatus Peregrinibacteria bacterium]|nr:glycosyltransferase family 4 protein [Candidatus Peregrinibacteria bacterium]